MALAILGTALSLLYSCKQTDAMEPLKTFKRSEFGKDGPGCGGHQRLAELHFTGKF